MINVSTTSISTTASSATTTPTVASTASSSASSTTAATTESSKPVISYQGTILSNLFDAADEFIRNEHLVPYQGVRYSNGTHGYIIQDEGAYLDVGKYNNYLFDKAATTLVTQAKEKGIELDKKDVIAQLKANNAEIAAMKLDEQDRRDKLVGNGYARLGWTDVQSLTDMYITAKENGLDVSQVKLCAFNLSSYLEAQTLPMVYRDRTGEIPEPTRKLAEVIREKLIDSLGFKMDFLNFILDPKTGLAKNDAIGADATEYAFLEFLSKIIDLKDKGLYYSSQNHDSVLNKAVTQGGDSSQS